VGLGKADPRGLTLGRDDSGLLPVELLVPESRLASRAKLVESDVLRDGSGCFAVRDPLWPDHGDGAIKGLLDGQTVRPRLSSFAAVAWEFRQPQSVLNVFVQVGPDLESPAIGTGDCDPAGARSIAQHLFGNISGEATLSLFGIQGFKPKVHLTEIALLEFCQFCQRAAFGGILAQDVDEPVILGSPVFPAAVL